MGEGLGRAKKLEKYADDEAVLNEFMVVKELRRTALPLCKGKKTVLTSTRTDNKYEGENLMKKVLKTILMGAVAFSLAMGVGCGTGENSSLEKKESSKAEDSSSQNKRRQLRDKSDYGKVIALTFDDGPNTDTTPLCA